MKIFWTMVCFLFTFIQTIKGEDFYFPNGFPYKASEFHIYQPTTYCQNANGGYKSLSNQSWNQEVPWINAGLHQSPNMKTVKFAKIPGNLEAWTEQEQRYADGHGYYWKWNYPKGTVFGEAIQTVDNNKKESRTVEIFVIEFEERDKPKFKRFRPFGKRDEISKYIVGETLYKERFIDIHGVNYDYKMVGKNNKVQPRGGSSIDVTGIKHEVTLSAKGVNEVLNRPFKDVTDIVFYETEGLKSYGVSTTQSNGIAPINNKAGLFSSKNCLDCHKTAGIEGRLLDPEPRPDKYGAIRGGGFIFSKNQK